MEATKNHFFSDMSVMLGRSMRHIFRSMDTIFTVCITPIAMMLLFVYVFGGAIQTGTDNYVNYLCLAYCLWLLLAGWPTWLTACLWISNGASLSGSTPCRLRVPLCCGGTC